MSTQLVVHDIPITDKRLVIKSKNTKKVSLAIRKTLDGNVLIQDHHSMNIVVLPDKGKIITFPKEEYNQDCYADQDDLFKFLVLSGVVKPDSVNGGSIFGSLEALFPLEKIGEEEPFEVVILNIHNFMNKAKQAHQIQKKFIDDLEKQLLHPEEEDSTEFGEIPQEKFKGSIPKWGFPSKGVYRYNY
jgi:hypothetical protein